VSLAVLCLISGPAAFAQSDTAQISGTVLDSSGSAVPNANIAVRNEATGLERRVTTNESGYYAVSSLSPGFYTVSVEAQGFKKYQKTQNKLDPNINTRVDAALEVGAITETVDVVAEVANVQSETATVGKLIEASQIQNMQLNGRNPLFLALLKPGVSGGALNQFSFGLTTGGLNINGSRTQDNLIAFDGAVAVRTRSNGTSIGVADLDSVQEVQVLTTNYNAEYGRSSGGQVRIVTKSGTRDFHGALYEYFRNSALDANSWSRNRTVNQPSISGGPDPFRYNQFGYNVNGPVYIPKVWNTDRSKLFFFWGQEWVRQRRASTAITTVPTLRMRNGDFSELLDPGNFIFGRRVEIRDPDTGQPFANNVIPQNRLSGNGLSFLRAYPEPVPGFFQGRSNFIQSRPTETDQRKDTISVDASFTEKHQTRFRFQNYNFIDTAAFRANTDRAPQIIDRPNQTFSVNHIWMISPTFISEFLGTASVDRVKIYVDTRGERYRRSNYGINYPYLFPERKEIFDKIPTIVIDQFTDLDGGPYPASSSGPIYVLSNNLTKISGNHTFKFGALFERAGQNDFDQINVSGVPGGTNNQNGRFVFDNTRAGGTTTGLAMSNAAMGLFTTYAEIGVRSYTPYRGHMFEWFVQDSWKATQKLRIELGLRHSIIQPYYSLWRNMVVFDPTVYDPALAATQDPRTGFITSGLETRYNGLVIPGDSWPDSAKGRIPIADTGEFNFLFRDGRFDKSYSETHYGDFQPRFGVAYSLNDRTVIRAGVGKFITRLGVSDSIFLGGNPPLQPMVSISNGVADNPAGGRPSNFPLNVTTQDRIFQNPMAYAWHAVVEREIGFDTTVEVGYVGRRGLRAQRERNINQLPVGTLFSQAYIDAGRPNVDTLRPYKGFGPIRITNNEANSLYHGLQIGVNRRFSKGLLFGVAYTYSKTWDDGSAQRDIIPNAFDAGNLWGPSSQDRRHVLVLNYIYELPFFRDHSTLVGKLLGGWQINGVSQFQTGTPFTIATGDDFAGVGSGSGSQIWNRNGDPFLSRGERAFSESTADQNFWFRPRNQDGTPIFTPPANGTFTTQENRNLLYNPGFQNWNIGLFKSFYITERQRLQFRAEAYNFINHPNWSNPDSNPRSSTFGKITAKNSERQLQLALRYEF
jgi:hypothetical protein